MSAGDFIREIQFSQVFGASVATAFTGSFPCTLGSKFVINGAILEVDVTYNRAGSFTLQTGRAQEVIFSNNAVSGTIPLVVRPAVFTQGATGSIAGALHTNYAIVDSLWFNVISGLSGTQPFTATVRYR